MEIKDCACYGVCPWLRPFPAEMDSRLREVHSKKKVDNAGNYGNVLKDPDNDTAQEARGLVTKQMELYPEDVVKTYKRRWLMLGLFCLFSMSNAYMWIHMNIIANVVLRYYNQSLPEDQLSQETAVDWLSMVYMLAYLICIPAGMYILDSCGLRVNNLVGSTFNALGAWLKCVAVSPSKFPVIMAAQTVCGIAQVFIVSIPPRLAAVWFGPNEVSTATAFGVFGNQLGVAVGFLVPPLIVPNSESLEEVGQDLGTMFYAGAAYCTLLMILMACVFQSRPPHPPSRAQLAMMRERSDERYHASVFRVMRNASFLLLMLSYGLNTGCYYAISTLLNYMVLHHFPGEEVNVGYIGLVIILTGIAGSLVAGFWLDRTKFFKSTSLAIYLMSAVGMLVFTFTLNLGHIWIVFVTAGLLGFFMTGYLPVGYEFAAEITFPESEGTASGLLTASAMCFGIVMTLGMRAMMNQVSILAANIFVSVVLLVGTVMTAFVKPRYCRQEAEHKALRDIDNLEVIVNKKAEEKVELTAE